MSMRRSDPRRGRGPSGVDASTGRGAKRGPRDADDGVLRRVRRRTARAAAVPASVGVALALTGWGWPGWFTRTTGAVIGIAMVALCGLAAAVIARRSQLWSTADRCAAAWSDAAADLRGAAISTAGWVAAACGAPQPLFRPSGTALWRRVRRFPAHVVALRAAAGPLATGEAVTVHGRPDGLLPSSGDALCVFVVAARGPYLVGRPVDGALFVADRWTFTAS